MRIAILGAGLMGGKLGTIFARAGHAVVFSYARSNDKLKKLARNAKGDACAGTPGGAVKEADALLLAVPWSRIDDVLKQAGDLSGKVIATCCLPMDSGNTKPVVGTTTSGATNLPRRLPRLVSSARSTPCPVKCCSVSSRQEARKPRPSLVYCGDDQGAKDVVAKLIDDAGFDAVDVGPLRIARYTEPFALLVGEIAHNGQGGPETAYRFERFNESAVR
jgi:predicted dinucleotide-binding enzyme